MALEGKGKLTKPVSNRTMIYVSVDVARDSAFPFKAGDDLWLRIEDGRLIVERA